MTPQQAHDFFASHPTVEQTRSEWHHKRYFVENTLPITAIVCQRNTKHLIQLTIESLQRFYPDINILVVDGGSNDDSILYLRYKELTCHNVNVWVRDDRNGHGLMLHEGISRHVKTEYVMLLDSDIIIERGGFIEPMLKRFEENKNLYAIGTLQYSSYINNGGEPETPDDAVPYANPQLSIYHVPTYHKLNAPFIEDGTPCILNMKAAKDAFLDVEYFPTDKYFCHVSGGTWMNPPNIWKHDHDVKLRPFLTVIVRSGQNIISTQNDSDYDIVVTAEKKEIKPLKHQPPVYQYEPNEVSYRLYGIRFNVSGEYILDASYYDVLQLPNDFVTKLKEQVIEQNIPDEIEIDGFTCIKRQIWQTQTV